MMPKPFAITLNVGSSRANSVERFPSDEALRQGCQVPVDAAPTGKRVLVVGAGPSGLSAACHLTRQSIR